MIDNLISIAFSKSLDAIYDLIKTKFSNKSDVPPEIKFKKSKLTSSLRMHHDQLSRRCKYIHILGMTHPKLLSDIYVALSISDDPRKYRMRNYDERGSYTIEDIIYLEENAVILGDPGAGKTTTFKRITNKLINDYRKKPENPIPVLLRFRDFDINYSITSELFKLLTIEFKHNLNTKEEVKQIYLKEISIDLEKDATVLLLDNLNIILLLDGFDEIPSIFQETVYREIEYFSHRLKKGKILISSRSADFKRNLPNFLTFEIQNLSDPQIDELIYYWFESSEKRTKSAKEFKIAFSKVPYSDLATRPLSLVTLCLIYEKYGSLPDLPIEVYRKIINLLLEEWDSERGITRKSKYSNFGSSRKRDFLSSFAFHLQLSTRYQLTFTSEKMIQIFTIICEKFEIPNEEGKETIFEIESHTGIIVKGGYDRYEFSHKSLQEFLVAEYLVKLRKLPSVLNILHYCPNELAIAVALSSDSTDWFVSLFSDLINSNLLDDFQIETFLRRILLENPSFQLDNELGLACLHIINCNPRIVDNNYCFMFFKKDSIIKSINMYLSLCKIFSTKGSFSIVPEKIIHLHHFNKAKLKIKKDALSTLIGSKIIFDNYSLKTCTLTQSFIDKTIRNQVNRHA